MKRGLFIVIDGTDWSWKKTQTENLRKKLLDDGFEVEKIDFPQYWKPSAGPTEEYLNWKFWKADEVTPYQASILYAVDRFSAANQIREWLDAWKVVISDRYVSANMGHQAGKIPYSRFSSHDKNASLSSKSWIFPAWCPIFAET